MALEDMTAEFGPRYSRGAQYLRQLAELEKKQAAAGGNTNAQHAIEIELKSLRQRAMLDHPLLKFDKLLFVKRLTDPAASGITTKMITEYRSTSNGTSSPDAPVTRSLTIGAKASSMMRSLTETCTSVYAGSPSDR